MRFGLIGHPIEHSLSPALFKAGYDGRYPYELIQTADFEEAYAHFLADYDGINVTAPFKELAIRKADILSEECKAIGATNLLIKTPEGIKAYNSDYLGLLICLAESSDEAKSVLPTWPQWEGFFSPRQMARHRALIVGLGGAGKAAKAAAEASGHEVVLMNRTQYSDEIKPLSQFIEEFRKADVIIYNLPVRIDGLDEITDELLTECGPKTIIEANYRNPSFDSGLIQRMKDANPESRYIGGKTWLLMQAVTGYEIFTGETPDLGKMSACL
ncbi:MAG: hypothetical protein IKW27_06820 [Bacteroidales bacterium]|nr:hypothetical protein [Bacteroidales bacterium]